MRNASLRTIALGAQLAILLAVPSPAVLGAQSEPWVTCVEADEPILLNYGVHTVDCAITPTADSDTFRFDAAAGDQVRIIVEGKVNGLDPRIELRDPNGEVIGDQSCTVNSYERCTATLNADLLASGTYWARVSDAGGNEAGPYQLQVERVWPTAVAVAVPYNANITDTVSPSTDMDFLEFEGNAGTEIEITVAGGTNGLDPRIALRDPNGEVIGDQSCTVNS